MRRGGRARRARPWPWPSPLTAHAAPTPVVLGSGPSTARDWSLKEVVVLAAASETVKGGSSPPAFLLLRLARGQRSGLHGCRLVVPPRTSRGRPCFLVILSLINRLLVADAACRLLYTQRLLLLVLRRTAPQRCPHRPWQQPARQMRTGVLGPGHRADPSVF